MKIINKVLLITVTVLIPLGVFAQEKLEEHKGFGNNVSSDKKYIIAKGVNYSFEGKLESKPKDGFNGTWIVDGIKIIVNDKTFIKQSKKIVKIGDIIEIKAKRVDDKIVAILLEQENSFFK